MGEETEKMFKKWESFLRFAGEAEELQGLQRATFTFSLKEDSGGGSGGGGVTAGQLTHPPTGSYWLFSVKSFKKKL